MLEDGKHRPHTPSQTELETAINLIYNEIKKENDRNSNIQFEKTDELNPDKFNKETVGSVSDYLKELNQYYVDESKTYINEKDRLIIELNKTTEDKKAFVEMKNKYTNESLENLVTNKNELDKIIEWKGELIQRADPIYKTPTGFRAHFLAPSKKLFGVNLTTFSANLIVIWSFSLFLAITLYYDSLRNLLERLGKLFKKKKF